MAMTTHGRGGSHRGMMGSITGRVLDGTMLPLLIVPPQPEHSETEQTKHTSDEHAGTG